MTDPLAEAYARMNTDDQPKRKAVSWKFTKINQPREFKIQSEARQAQRTVFGTSEPDFWDLRPGQTAPDPKLAVVFDVYDVEEGEDRSLWLPIPGPALEAVGAAQVEAGEKIGPGGVLIMKQTGEKSSNKGNPQKIYAAKYTPPAKDDPLAVAHAAAKRAADPWADAKPAAVQTDEDAPPF